MFKYAICTSEGAGWQEPVLFRGRYTDALSYAKKLGAQGIEIHLRDAADVDAKELLEESRRQGMQIAGIATGLAKRIDGLSLVDDDKVRRTQAIERVMGHLELADQFGCPVIIGSMRSNIPVPKLRQEYGKRLTESVRILAESIKGKKCTIVFEAINRYENNYLNTAAETAEFVRQVDSCQVKLLLDLFHMNIEEEDTPMALRQYADVLGHVHIADSNRCYPGRGQTDFKRILQTLKDIHYSGWLSLEYLPIPSEDKAAERGMQYMKLMEQYS